jgi:hypothetical protein
MELGEVFMAAGKKTCGGVCDRYNDGVCLGLCLAGDEYVGRYLKKRELEEKLNPIGSDTVKVLTKREINIPEVNRREEDAFDIKFTV